MAELPEYAQKAGLSKNDLLVTTDVGQHQMFAAQYYPVENPRTFLTSGSLGTMGFGLPAAIGASLANPSKRVVCFSGDGSIMMNIQELATCKQYNLTPKIIMLNNGVLGMVRQWQRLDYESRYSETYVASLPDFNKLAEASGHVGFRIEKPADVEGALREAFSMKDKLVFMNFLTDSSENVWPMVKAGKGLTEMLMSLEDK